VNDIIHNSAPRGFWRGDAAQRDTSPHGLKKALRRIHQPVFVVRKQGATAVSHSGTVSFESSPSGSAESWDLMGVVPPLRPDALGDPGFLSFHGVRRPYVAGAMANGITSVDMVAAVARAGMLGFFGAAGLAPDTVAAAIDTLQQRLGDLPFGANLIYSPQEPDLEAAIVDLYLQRGVHRISASAYLRITPPLVHYRVKGIHRDDAGAIQCPNRVVAKVSREEVAEKFLSPPPEKILRELVASGKITMDEASLGASMPMADDISAEADSGGHTDNRPALTLLPTMLALRDNMVSRHGYARRPAIGLGGGIATPESAAAAFAMGAAYILIGTVNQACVESGTCDAVRQMLAEAGQADVTMAPAADMFEMGVKVQVLKRGTMFAVRAAKLYDTYQRHSSWASVPGDLRESIERDILRSPFEEEWGRTRAFFTHRDPRQVERAEKDPRHLMALVFRSYLGQSSKWSVNGVPDRRIDYQVWCGPAIGAFNRWTQGTFLEKPENRRTVTVARNLLVGACVVTRAAWLRQQGIALPPDAARFAPLTDDELDELES
jgi:trans-AT polyketide synthase/acyltransferase/oxidoreductase domain-containing protein